jgi:heme exporter protein D
MNWNGWNDFWAMGGYAFYVWGSYGATLALILTEIFLLRLRRRKALAASRQSTGAQHI